MRREERLLDALGGISDRYIIDAAPGARKAVRREQLKAAAAAACLLLVLGAVSAVLAHALGAARLGEHTAIEAESGGYGATSEKYGTLPELLEYLSSHDSHDGSQSDGLGGGKRISSGSAGAGITEGSAAAVSADGNYAFHIGEGTVRISRLDGEKTARIADIDQPADALFCCGETLATVYMYCSGGTELDEEYSVRVSFYDVSSPEHPVMLDEYTQLGSLSACWLAGERLYIVTEDGVCACGWSRLSDTSGYYPSLSHGGEKVLWGDEDIAILGEPSRVQYSAVTVIDMSSREVTAKKALYGDIKDIFCGTDGGGEWLAASVAAETQSYTENPVVYTFDGALGYTGRISTAQMLSVPEKNKLRDYERQDGTYIGITSVTRKDGVYRVLGTCSRLDGGSSDGYIMAAAADIAAGGTGCELLSASGYPFASYTEIIWRDDIAIACIGVINNAMTANMTRETRFVFARFDGTDIGFCENDLRTDYLDSRVGTTYGSPFGEFDTLVPLGGGLYARYTGSDVGPGGFELYDLSDISHARRVYSPGQSLSGADAFDYAWHVYDGNTFGTLKVISGSSDSFRDVSLAWCVYSVDPSAEQPFRLEREYRLGEEYKTFFGADDIGFAVFAAGDDVYCAARGSDSPVYIG